MKRGMEPFLVLNRSISSKSVANDRHLSSNCWFVKEKSLSKKKKTELLYPQLLIQYNRQQILQSIFLEYPSLRNSPIIVVLIRNDGLSCRWIRADAPRE